MMDRWSEESFDRKTIERELRWAADLGMNLMRVFLHDRLYEQDPEGFLGRIDYYLDIAHSLGIKTSPVFFDDCWNPTFELGAQPEPQPFIHNSTFKHCLPLLKKKRVWAINWGLVSGRSNTIYPWGWSEKKGEPGYRFHDIFKSDGTMLYEEERRQITSILRE